ncbi:hypothetical protein MTR67_039929, partial [Solanum verrucosum]
EGGRSSGLATSKTSFASLLAYYSCLFPLIDKQGVFSPNSSYTDETRELFRRDRGKQSFNEV